MKRIIILTLAVLALSFNLSAQEAAPVISVESMEVDYGTIEQDSDPIRVFKITNTGDAPLLITNARGSCGCTAPQREDWSRPIAVGETREMRVRYDTHRVGPFRKRVTLTHNAGDDTILTITGKVEPKAAAPEALPVENKGIFNGGNN